MTTNLTLKELQDLHFTCVEKFFYNWFAKKINQVFLEKLSNTPSDVSKVILKCLEDGRNPFIANGIKIKDQNRKWNKSDKIIKQWKEKYNFDVLLFILNYEQEHEHKSFHQLNDPILTLNAYTSIIGSYIVQEYLDEARSLKN